MSFIETLVKHRLGMIVVHSKLVVKLELDIEDVLCTEKWKIFSQSG